MQARIAADAREYVFGTEAEPYPVVMWHRITFYQLVSLKLVVKEMLRDCPAYADAPPEELYIPNEPARWRLAFRVPVRLFASAHNPGAAAAAPADWRPARHLEHRRQPRALVR